MIPCLGETRTPIMSALTFLEDHSPRVIVQPEPSAPPCSHSVVLSRVVASAERLELELAHAMMLANADTSKAVEAARIEALRSHIGGLKSVQRECYYAEVRAEARTTELAEQLGVVEKECKKLKQETARLRWALSLGDTLSKKNNAALAFMGAGVNKAKQEVQAASGERASVQKEMAAYQHQLDEANAENDALHGRLAEERREHGATLAAAIKTEREMAKKAADAAIRTINSRADSVQKVWARKVAVLEGELKKLKGEDGDGGGNGGGASVKDPRAFFKQGKPRGLPSSGGGGGRGGGRGRGAAGLSRRGGGCCGENGRRGGGEGEGACRGGGRAGRGNGRGDGRAAIECHRSVGQEG